MDITERKITKIARETEKLVLLSLREEGVGTAEIDLIHALRHHPGCTQAALAELRTQTRQPSRGGQKIWKRKASWYVRTTRTTAAVSCCIPRKRRKP